MPPPIHRGDLHWLLLPREGARPVAHPHVVVQDDVFNHSRVETVLVCALSTNPKRAHEPGNVVLDPGEGGLDRPSIVVVSQISSIPKTALGAPFGRLTAQRVDQIVAGLRFLQASGFTR
ncbi:MAG: type II toxin-antitoxin system PemK/MazF family toxin [Myxococcota bacterium]